MTTQAPPLDTAALARQLRGTLIGPADAGYDDARRVWNAMIDRRPALIARCAGPEDVAACLAFAREHDLPITVRGGGHNVAGSAVCDDGLVLDLSPMKAIDVDPEARRVRAGGGVTIGTLDRATVPHGLAAPMGVVTETGLAGLTLGGGFGWQTRKHGLACDALRAAEVVTADGRALRASADEHPDLFWALRGGGGNFGVVTAFEYELYPVEQEVFFLATFYPVAAAHRVLEAAQAFLQGAPDAFSGIGVVGHVPPVEAIPATHHDAPCVILVGAYLGPVAEGARALDPLRRLAEPLADLSGPTPFLEVQQFFDEDYPSGDRYYWTSIRLKHLPAEAVDTLLALNAAAPSARSTLDVWLMSGGAAGRVPAGATAFGDRSAPFLIGVEANWHDPADDAVNVAWGRRCVEAMRPYAAGGSYLNFPGFAEAGEAQVRDALGPNYRRLQAIKAKYDPDNVFRTHQNVRPAAAA